MQPYAHATRRIMEDNLNVFENWRRPPYLSNKRRPQYLCKLKTTSILLNFKTTRGNIKDDLSIIKIGRWPQYFENGRQPHFCLNGRRPYIFSPMEDNLNYSEIDDDLNIFLIARKDQKFKKMMQIKTIKIKTMVVELLRIT